jgi:hypothetical protein
MSSSKSSHSTSSVRLVSIISKYSIFVSLSDLVGFPFRPFRSRPLGTSFRLRLPALTGFFPLSDYTIPQVPGNVNSAICTNVLLKNYADYTLSRTPRVWPMDARLKKNKGLNFQPSLFILKDTEPSLFSCMVVMRQVYSTPQISNFTTSYPLSVKLL